MKAAYSILWVDPVGDTLLGVSSRKIRWGLDSALFSFSWTSFSLNVICCSVFLRCLYQPMTLSCGAGTGVSVTQFRCSWTAKLLMRWTHWLYLLIVGQEFLYNVHIHVTDTIVEAENTTRHKTTAVNIWDHIWKVLSILCNTHLFSSWQGMCFCTSVKKIN